MNPLLPVGEIVWAGVPFLAIAHHDAHFLRAPGLYGFARRHGPGARVLLYLDHADDIARAASPAHPLWADALRLGMNELHVCLKARERLDRLQLRHHLIRRVEPILNLVGVEEHEPAEPAPAWRSSAG